MLDTSFVNRHGWAIKLGQSAHCYDVECRRNELVALDLVITAVSTMFAFVAMIGELCILIRIFTRCCLFCCLCPCVCVSMYTVTLGHDSKLYLENVPGVV